MIKNSSLIIVPLVFILFTRCSTGNYIPGPACNSQSLSKKEFEQFEYERGVNDARKDINRSRLYLVYPAGSLKSDISYFLWLKFDIDKKKVFYHERRPLAPSIKGYNDTMFEKLERMWGSDFEEMFIAKYKEYKKQFQWSAPKRRAIFKKTVCR